MRWTGVTGEVWQRKLTPDPADIHRWVSGLPGPVQVGYEAGPTGYGLYRYLVEHGVRCSVGAPSKLQRPHGDRVKTDAKDAELLARLLLVDQFVEVVVPSVEQEAARDLVRAREDVRGDLMRARHRVSKMLLRQRDRLLRRRRRGPRSTTAGCGAQRFDQPGRQLAYESAYETMIMTVDRRDRLDTAIEAMAADSSYTPVVRRLGCLRGISTLTGFGLAVEIGDWTRFSGATIGAFVGLVPTENSSGQSRSQGSITKAGNTHARRLLVEAAWHHAKPYRVPGQDDAGPLGARPGRRPGPRPRRQPAAAPTLAGLQRPQEATRRRRRRRRPRARRLGLVPGRARVAQPPRLLPPVTVTRLPREERPAI